MQSSGVQAVSVSLSICILSGELFASQASCTNMPNEGGLLGLARPPLTFPRMTHQAGKPLDLVDTEYSACSVATRPLGDRSLVATGLYQIVKDDSADGTQDASAPATKRLGRCLLSRIDGQGKLYVQLCAPFRASWTSTYEGDHRDAAERCSG